MRQPAAVLVLVGLGVTVLAGSSFAVGHASHVSFGKAVNGATKCFTLALTDSLGAPVDGYVSITFVRNSNGSSQGKSYGLSTDGTYNVCYGNGSLPPSSDITAFADENGNGTQDAGEPNVTATAQ